MRKVQRKPPIFSLAHEAYTDSDDDYIEMQAYITVNSYIHGWPVFSPPVCQIQLSIQPPLSLPLTRHHLSPPTARM